MDGGAIAGIVIAIVVVLITVIILIKSVYIVHQAQGIVIERFGKFKKVLQSGIHLVPPIVEKPRPFTWRKTYIGPGGNIVDEVVDTFRIDLRESVFNFLRQEVFTRDTVYINVNALMYYSIDDIKKAVYEVDDLSSALSNTAQTQMKEVFGNMTFSEALESQKKINVHLKKEFSNLFSGWGIHVERMELLDLRPAIQTQEAMKKQMIAERHRRADFILSEGKKSAMQLRSEGFKVVKVNLGLAEQEATRKRSEGEAGARVELATADSTALEKLADEIRSDGYSNVQYMISQRYIELFRQISDAKTKEIYLPYRLEGLSGMIDGLPGMFQGARPKSAKPSSRRGERSSEMKELD
uniref:Band 7 domain-containing protein n=1 Tax=Palpitomonas bilix TaxID=652834 RepID=A0A7S3GF14_9EUKA|mmetsp:Transcript_46721/g.120441  ORF Transcript_46721/g.120441 Transcript_46721/m.120441 type:complete len:353 (+) Transcript_46721:45-1103(+)